MRPHSLLILLAGLAPACDDGPGPSTDGTLVISTSTAGDHPDPDGYLLVLDDLDSLVLEVSDTAELEVAAGPHTVEVLGVADHCSVPSGTPLEVNVTPGGRTPAEFAVDCPGTGINVAMTTTGLDRDEDGYRVTVNTVDREAVLANGVALILLGPGEVTIGVTGLAPNCAMEGPASKSVTVVDRVIMAMDFAVTCTARSGVIGVAIATSGVDPEGEYLALVDGVGHITRPDRTTYLTGIAPGDHVVTLGVPSNCSSETDPQSVTVTAGTTMRDTAEVSFSVTCEIRPGILRATAITTGTSPPTDYSVWICEQGFYCRFYPYLLGALDPNGSLTVPVEPGSYEIWLEDVPSTCGIRGPSLFTIALRDTVDVVYAISCP
jgi:hypothetical protein